MEEREKDSTLILKKKLSPSRFLFMEYWKCGDEVLYTPEFHRRWFSTGERNDCESVVGLFCMKCGAFREYSDEEFRQLLKSDAKAEKTCTCGNCWQDVDRIKNTNGNNRAVLNKMIPAAVSITEKDDKIRVSAAFEIWGFNAKARKPYVLNKVKNTVVINTATKQAYQLPLLLDGKKLNTTTRNLAFSQIYEMYPMNEIFVDEPELMKTLLEAYAAHVPEVDRSLKDLHDLVAWNHLRDLYPMFNEIGCLNQMVKYSLIRAWRLIRRRYVKDSGTFPHYLYRGCEKVASKSIKKILYRYPEQRWTLKFLYHELGMANIDILRNILADRAGLGMSNALEFYFDFSKEEKEGVRQLISLCSEAGMTDKQKAEFFFSEDVDWMDLRDTARMLVTMSVNSGELLDCRDVKEFHNKLIRLWRFQSNRALYERYSMPVQYSESINKLEGHCEGADFHIIRKPLDLEYVGEKFHNCVGGYMRSVADGKSIIVEMDIGGKPSACIELDSSGRQCYQAYAACNVPLKDEPARIFDAWAGKHRIQRGCVKPPQQFDFLFEDFGADYAPF